MPHLEDRVNVSFPNGEIFAVKTTRATLLIKAVLEAFAPRFLSMPAAVRVALRGTDADVRGIDHRDALGLTSIAVGDLPDIILADVDPDAPKIVFVEVVATDGPITEQRKTALMQVAEQAGIQSDHVYFLTAFADRSAPVFRKLVSELAWGTFAWFSSEPEKLLAFREGQTDDVPALFNY